MATKDNNQHATTGKDWRRHREEGVLIRLPSGNSARLRAVSPQTLIRLGRVPDVLTPLLVDLMEGRKNPEDLAPQNLKELDAMVEFQEAVCKEAFVYPKIVDNPQNDDEISIDDVCDADRKSVMGVLGATVQLLELFRDQQARDVDALHASEGDSPTSEPDHADRKVGTRKRSTSTK